MNQFMLGTLTFLIVAPAISICDEDLNKAAQKSRESNIAGIVTQPNYANMLQNIYSDEGTDYQNANSYIDPWSFYRQLRAPSGFFGVRGKKDFEPESEDLFAYQSKRQPSQAFFGMRGKKLYEDKRAPSGFFGVRGKKDEYEGESDDNLQAELYRELQQERLKMASLLGGYLDEKEKRKPSGFVGLRGKKSVNNDDYYEFEKRAPMGFQGVRGKKSEYTNYLGSAEKRAPVAGFFGMRGKKQPFGYQSSSNFFGVRKKPYMPYGKFVGVRGKKDQTEGGVIKRLRFESDSLNSLTNAQRVPPDSAQDKRIGFIGMRG